MSKNLDNKKDYNRKVIEKKKPHSAKDSRDKQEYDPNAIEKHWQEIWKKEGLYKTPKDPKNKKYILDMFPYPSGSTLHVGHVEGYVGTDIIARFERMKGSNVLHPMGWDAFGLPAENYAIKSGIRPDISTHDNIKVFKRQLESVGLSYDWSHEIDTSDPKYYKWTQWIFTLMFKRGLAYKKKADVNWCPSCETVLANEQVVDGRCERCDTLVVQKKLDQWFLKITDYADRLISGLDKIDWLEEVKIQQKNWIGKSEGARIKFKIKDKRITNNEIEVFTTRPDTLFGATFMVVSPEHPLVSGIENKEVRDYIEAAKAKTDSERTEEDKEKTGVFSGLYAINPVNGEEIPVWIADYVLAGYGTGAIMAVPAHDTRDFEFAKKFNLPIRQVVAPYTVMVGEDVPIKDEDIVYFDAATCILRHWNDSEKFYVVEFKTGQKGFPGGSIEDGEGKEEAIKREIIEETGYKNIKSADFIFEHAYSRGHKARKNREEECHDAIFVVELADDEQEKMVDKQIESGKWLTSEEILNDPKFFSHHKIYLEHYLSKTAYTGSGRIVNSGEWNGLFVPDDINRIIDKLEEKGIGKRESSYHLRDWLISRQRYWGVPIPMIFCLNCAEKGHGERPDMPGWYTVSEDDLPVLLPTDVDFRPTGESPIARSASFQKGVICPGCGSQARREVDTMDTYVDSSWYFIRFVDPENTKELADPQKIKEWLPVDVYVGGGHVVQHLLFARFFWKVLFDAGLIDQSCGDEPFLKLRAPGWILGPDSRKMSKRWKNVITPDDIIPKFGADTLRMYEMFMGPFDAPKPWSLTGVEGMSRFLARLWRFVQAVNFGDDEEETKKMINRTVKNVTEDLEKLSYNTAIAKLMEFYNFAKDKKTISKDTILSYLKLIAPFTPHMAEELYQQLTINNEQVSKKSHEADSKFESIHFTDWPDFDEKYLVEDEIIIPVQVNGKRRGEITIKNEQLKMDNVVEEKAREAISSHLEGKEVRKVIYVPGKIINFVV